MVEHQQKRIGEFEKEKKRQQGERDKEQGKINQLEKDIKRLERQLKDKKNTGAEALDTTTGIRTTAYDQGDGTVVVKRIHPDGREEVVRKYTRRSSQDIKRDLAAKKKALERHKNSVKKIKKRIEALTKAIARAKSLLQDAITAFLACLDNCNAAQGIITKYSTAQSTPKGDASTTPDVTGTGITGQATDTTVGNTEKAANAVIDSAERTATEAIDSSRKAIDTTKEKTTDTVQKQEYSYGLDSDWNLSVKYKWSSGYTYFDLDKHLSYDYAIDPKIEYGQTDKGIDKPAKSSTSTSTDISKRWSLGYKYKFNERFNIAGIPFTYKTEEPLTDKAATSINNRFITLNTNKIFLYPRHITNAFGMLDWGAPASAVGSSVGRHYRGKNTFVPAWYNAALETVDILDEYDEWEDDVYPLEYGSAVFHAVLAAGGNQRDASIMAARATAHAGGTRLEVLRSRFSAYTGPFFYGFGAENAPSWKIKIWMPPHIRYLHQPASIFSPSLLQQSPPTNYFGIQHQFKYKFNDSFIGLNNLNLDDNTTQGYSVSKYTSIWEKISPRISFTYDITGDGKHPINWNLAPSWIRNNLDVDVGSTSIMHVPTGLFVNFSENNLLRDPQAARGYPNDPHYRGVKESTTTSIAKTGLGMLFGAVGIGIEEPEFAANHQWGLPAIGLRPLGQNSGWDIYDGQEPNVVVAVIDSGLDLQHPDGPAYLWVNKDEIPQNGKDDDGNGYIDDINGWNFIAENHQLQDDFGHGTFVSGIIAAKTNNGIGIAGVNPGARIMTLKVADDTGKASSLSIYRAIRYGVDNGARIINISLGREGISKLEQLGVNYAWNMGCLVIVAAGNQAGRVSKHGPAGLSRTFSVASIDVNGTQRATSNVGRTVAISGPGEAIYSLSSSTGKIDKTMIPFTSSEYHQLHGTSFAAPYVAGTASLVWAKYPDLTNLQLTHLLIETARDANEKGWDIKTGAGMVNARAALEYANRPMVAVRITDLRLEKRMNDILWADLYGVIDGPVKSYTVWVAEKTQSGEEKFFPVYGPAAFKVDDGFICRIPGKMLKGKQWSFRITALTEDGQTKRVKMSFNQEGDVIY